MKMSKALYFIQRETDNCKRRKEKVASSTSRSRYVFLIDELKKAKWCIKDGNKENLPKLMQEVKDYAKIVGLRHVQRYEEAIINYEIIIALA